MRFMNLARKYTWFLTAFLSFFESTLCGMLIIIAAIVIFSEESEINDLKNELNDAKDENDEVTK